ncbi:hypothetical protein SCL_2537 [Sulfuricaulis limicola]|uniref:PEP-CTERM protein-sorting domain-containing protein n=1 Tax=Sulfuricaulis limicola TaxID=1620215 RepID=A0A1B4XJ39_9GAMM|nr:hypothetical protein [Sulfuricaulis limicola]BAV34814.1 hypothetical protein SCL_2537 [Sulfuricaulis limicola]
MLTNKSLSRSFIFLLGLLAVPCAKAAPVTFGFTGFVYEVIDPLLANRFSENQAVSGSYTFESTALATYPNISNPNVVDYPGLLNISLTIGDYTATYNPSSFPGMIRIVNDLTGWGDSYEVWAGMSGASIGGIPPSFFVTAMNDWTGMALSSLALPVDASQLASFDNQQFQLIFTEYVDPLTMIDHVLDGEITSITTSVVPLPGALLLFVSGLFVSFGSFGFLKKRRRHQA